MMSNAITMMKALVILSRPASVAAVSESIELAQVPSPDENKQLLVRVDAASLQVSGKRVYRDWEKTTGKCHSYTHQACDTWY